MTGGRRQGQRRLAAILFADVVGYSRMVAEDEAAALARVSALRRRVVEPRIAAHGGRPFAALGDGFVSAFPSAVEAVACAVEVQGELLAAVEGATARPWQGLALRIGVSLGDVVVEPDGAVYGDGVNIAARLQALAEPGGVLASGEVHGQLAGRLTLPFEDIGERELKNIPHAVRLFALPAAAVAALPAPGGTGGATGRGVPVARAARGSGRGRDARRGRGGGNGMVGFRPAPGASHLARGARTTAASGRGDAGAPGPTHVHGGAALRQPRR
ncbi:adenylate/guanylate cyclase domain-containing protein [Siccirubricoccus sp. G192]|uniref:adenylate/guanylate cyclase domain-containing protein n=1 Tax=Siccirubricoccus sp. G192 TaxID=2849651 RepID=UPI001C2B86EA|nr:adenylate/guanylate cyclase domain-containing protein [Siccirubricoccus sp. G192]MBV1799571.1 adenylate/guanylate cyclase domain-containing protein [Siccirubricoccus sp. G192]